MLYIAAHNTLTANEYALVHAMYFDQCDEDFLPYDDPLSSPTPFQSSFCLTAAFLPSSFIQFYIRQNSAAFMNPAV